MSSWGTYDLSDSDRARQNARLAAKLIAHHRLDPADLRAARSPQGWDVGIARIHFDPATGHVAAQVPKRDRSGVETGWSSIEEVVADERVEHRLRRQRHAQARADRAAAALDRLANPPRRSTGLDRGL